MVISGILNEKYDEDRLWYNGQRSYILVIR